MTIWNHQQEQFLDNHDMKNILLFLAFTILWPIEIYCQHINKISDEYGVVSVPVNDSTIVYCTKKGKKYEVKANQISFVGGESALVDYLRKEYYKPGPDDDYTYRVFFFVLFDSRLKIKEVRGCVLPLNQYTESKKNRVKQYITGLQKWYVYSFSFATD